MTLQTPLSTTSIAITSTSLSSTRRDTTGNSSLKGIVMFSGTGAAGLPRTSEKRLASTRKFGACSAARSGGQLREGGDGGEPAERRRGGVVVGGRGIGGRNGAMEAPPRRQPRSGVSAGRRGRSASSCRRWRRRRPAGPGRRFSGRGTLPRFDRKRKVSTGGLVR